MEEIVALICLLCIGIALILFGIFLPIKDYISKKRFYINIESTDVMIMKKIIENSDFLIITDINYDKERI